MRSTVPNPSLRTTEKTLHQRIRYVFVIGTAIGACILAAWLIAGQASTLPKENILAAFQEGTEYCPLTIRYPLSGTVFPPAIVPPAFRWEDSNTESDA